MQLINKTTGEILKLDISDFGIKKCTLNLFESEALKEKGVVSKTYSYKISPDFKVEVNANYNLAQNIMKTIYDYLLSRSFPELEGFELATSNRHWLFADKPVMVSIDKAFALEETWQLSELGQLINYLRSENKEFVKECDKNITIYLDSLFGENKTMLEAVPEMVHIL